MIRTIAATAAVAFAAGALIGYHKGDGDRFAAMSADWSAQQLRQSQEYAQRLADANRDLEALRAAERARSATYEANLADAQRRADRLADSLRQRPERPAAMPAAAGSAPAAQGCTGAELYRGDAEFLVREAARADRLRAALERCQGGDAEPVSDGTRMDR